MQLLTLRKDLERLSQQPIILAQATLRGLYSIVVLQSGTHSYGFLQALDSTLMVPSKVQGGSFCTQPLHTTRVRGQEGLHYDRELHITAEVPQTRRKQFHTYSAVDKDTHRVQASALFTRLSVLCSRGDLIHVHVQVVESSVPSTLPHRNSSQIMYVSFVTNTTPLVHIT